jgi:Cysteine-rich CPCC
MSLQSRVMCPCCGYLTLSSRADYEICELCNWEDDGQDDEDADEVWGGPNSDYSLTEARANFLKYRVMYAPDRDQRITRGDSPLEYETKGLLIAALKAVHSCNPAERKSLEQEVFRLEEILRSETSRKIKEYEAKQ